MRKLAVVCIGLLGLAVLVGCGSEKSSTSAPDRASAYTVAPAAPPGLREQSPAGKGAQDNNAPARKEVITGSVDIVADDPIEAAGKIADQVRAAGGRIDSRTEQPRNGDDPAEAALNVRVPADKTDKFIDGLGGIGKVTKVKTDRDDVTMKWEDLDARIRALQASVDRLRDLISRAANTADLLAAEQALSSRQADLDSLTAQKRRLDDEVSLSTLTIEITSTAKASEQGPDSFWDGLVAGWHSLVNWLKDAVVFLGRALPWLGFLAVLGAIGWGIVAAVRRRGKDAGQSTPGPTGPAPVTQPAAPGAGTGATGAPEGRPGDNQTEQP
ncbi:DUF4349 domain-containing protein [Nocardia sp. NPDC052566]|uniref:DUF4349 domain-containing protein n=1 Tax=Nocardia sp. NPDC052566 TaxID=3364330 RepID=UPI0037C761BE